MNKHECVKQVLSKIHEKGPVSGIPKEFKLTLEAGG